MDIKQQLDPILDKWNLLKHPFYQAWSAGTLPVDALSVYAREYGEFITALPLGWEALRDDETAEEEREHTNLWNDFRLALGETAAKQPVKEARELAQTARELFSTPASALGALYAFEAQQPPTAQSKLEGLRVHYQLPAAVEPYFQIHSSNWHESQKILKQMDDLTHSQQAEAVAACERMAEALWNALSGIHKATCEN